MDVPRMQALTRRLIEIDSVTGNEAAICGVLHAELQARGMRARRLPVDATRFNLLGSYADAPPRIVFNTHVDTVPPQYGPHEDQRRIYGRGAADTHGVLAAQLEAMDQLHADGIPGLGVLLLVGEEHGHAGARSAAASPDVVEPDILVVGEPTENKLATAQKGMLKATLTTSGREGHSGYPERFQSAVDTLVRVLGALRHEPWLGRTSEAGTTLNVTRLRSDAADNKVPARASARLMFRCAEVWGRIRERTEAAVQRATPPGDSAAVHLAWDDDATDPVTTLASLPGFETTAAAFNTDIPYLAFDRCRTFLFGPGSILRAHRDLNGDDWERAEWIDKAEQQLGAELYVELIRKAVA